MFESSLRIPNVCWLGDQPKPLDLAPDGLDHVHGRFATAHQDGGRILLARDKLGLNKLYFAIDPTRGLVAANYLADLLDGGIGLDSIHAVPAGASVDLDVKRRRLTVRRYHRLPRYAGGVADPAATLATARRRLTRGFEQLAAAYPDTRVALCLSGGLDSALIAALATRHFSDIAAYTYTFSGPTRQPSSDAVAAERLAAHLGLPFHLVTADSEARSDCSCPSRR